MMRPYLATTCDVFQSVKEVQEVSRRVIEICLTHGKEVAFLTKGIIEQETLAILKQFPSKVYAQIGINTLDQALSMLFEPGAALPEKRLEQAKVLVDMGVNTTTRIDPLFPGVTDSEEQLDALFSALKGVGITNVSINYLFLMPEIKKALMQAKSPIIDKMLKTYVGSKRIYMRGSNISSVVPVPKEQREDVYITAQKLAMRHGIHPNICACKNADIEDVACCDIGGPKLFQIQQKIHTLQPRQPLRHHHPKKKNKDTNVYKSCNQPTKKI
jgi:DNA repair photolyase